MANEQVPRVQYRVQRLAVVVPRKPVDRRFRGRFRAGILRGRGLRNGHRPLGRRAAKQHVKADAEQVGEPRQKRHVGITLSVFPFADGLRRQTQLRGQRLLRHGLLFSVSCDTRGKCILFHGNNLLF